jgi:hypothetical protein
MLKGDLLSALDGGGEDEAGAERWYRLALQRARDLKTPMSQLRAAMRLCRPLREQGRTDEGVRLLGGVHETFTEGFGTADLLEAREILAAVRQS